MASTGIASYGSTDSEMRPPLKRTMPTRFVQLFRAHLSAALNFVEPITGSSELSVGDRVLSGGCG